MSILISGKAAKESFMKDLAGRFEVLADKGIIPTLAIVQVGDRSDSTAFIRAKASFGRKVGASTKHVHFSEKVSSDEVISEIQRLNSDDSIHGIIVQLPLPEHIDKAKVISTIMPSKDADALTPERVAAWSSGDKNALLPATARGVRELIAFYNISLKDKKVTVIGRSDLVGKPVAAMCVAEGANVTVCHSGTQDIPSKARTADVVIVAIGKPWLINEEYFSKGQVVIDIGINRIDGEKLEEEISGAKLVGDVDYESVKDFVGAVTPVPGGVGPMTVLALFENLVDLCKRTLV